MPLVLYILEFRFYEQKCVNILGNCAKHEVIQNRKHTNLLLGLSTVPTSDAWWWYPVPTPTRLPVPIEIGCDTAWSVKDKYTCQCLQRLFVRSEPSYSRKMYKCTIQIRMLTIANIFYRSYVQIKLIRNCVHKCKK